MKPFHTFMWFNMCCIVFDAISVTHGVSYLNATKSSNKSDPDPFDLSDYFDFIEYLFGIGKSGKGPERLKMKPLIARVLLSIVVAIGAISFVCGMPIPKPECNPLIRPCPPYEGGDPLASSDPAPNPPPSDSNKNTTNSSDPYTKSIDNWLYAYDG